LIYQKINNKLPVAWEGIPFILIGIVATSMLFILNWELLAVPMAVATLFTIYFFRDPKRTHVDDERAIFTPADGTVLSVENLLNGDYRLKDKAIKISIFMSIFNAHINRIPIKGKNRPIILPPWTIFFS